MPLNQTFNQDSLGNIGTAASATTAAPAYSSGTYNPLSLTLAGALRVDGSAVTQPISASTLPLPTGAGTSANQSLILAQLTAINGKLPTALGTQVTAASLAVNIASDQVVPVSNAATASSTSALSSVTAATSSTTLLAANAARKGIMLFNDSTAIAYVAYAATATITAYSIKMQPQSFYESDAIVYKGLITVIYSAANGSMRATELT